MKKIIKILCKINVIFFIIQFFVPVFILVILLEPYMPELLYDWLNTVFNFPIILLLQLLFIIETVFLQNYFPKKQKKIMCIFCFVGTVLDLLMGHLLFIGSIY